MFVVIVFNIYPAMQSVKAGYTCYLSTLIKNVLLSVQFQRLEEFTPTTGGNDAPENIWRYKRQRFSPCAQIRLSMLTSAQNCCLIHRKSSVSIMKIFTLHKETFLSVGMKVKSQQPLSDRLRLYCISQMIPFSFQTMPLLPHGLLQDTHGTEAFISFLFSIKKKKKLQPHKCNTQEKGKTIKLSSIKL